MVDPLQLSKREVCAREWLPTTPLRYYLHQNDAGYWSVIDSKRDIRVGRIGHKTKAECIKAFTVKRKQHEQKTRR